MVCKGRKVQRMKCEKQPIGLVETQAKTLARYDNSEGGQLERRVSEVRRKGGQKVFKARIDHCCPRDFERLSLIVVQGGTSLPDTLFKGQINDDQIYFLRVSWWSRVDMPAGSISRGVGGEIQIQKIQ